MKHVFFATIMLVTFAGCERTRSFLQMDSNSNSPFMGLQLSVDAKRQAGNDLEVKTVSSSAVKSLSDRLDQASTTAAVGNDKADFVPTAGSRANAGNLKFSLPKADLSNSPEAAAEVEDILTRI